MSDAEFQKVVAETMEHVRAGRRVTEKLWGRWPKGCRDCGCPDPEFYMANDDVWVKANGGLRHGVLCLRALKNAWVTQALQQILARHRNFIAFPKVIDSIELRRERGAMSRPRLSDGQHAKRNPAGAQEAGGPSGQ
jgi:hypothetical protein